MFSSNIKMWENVILVTLWHHGLYPGLRTTETADLLRFFFYTQQPLRVYRDWRKGWNTKLLVSRISENRNASLLREVRWKIVRLVKSGSNATESQKNNPLQKWWTERHPKMSNLVVDGLWQTDYIDHILSCQPRMGNWDYNRHNFTNLTWQL